MSDPAGGGALLRLSQMGRARAGSDFASRKPLSGNTSVAERLAAFRSLVHFSRAILPAEMACWGSTRERRRRRGDVGEDGEEEEEEEEEDQGLSES